MATILRDNKNWTIWHRSSQLRSAICYILVVTAAVLGFNIYTSSSSRNLLFHSKYSELDSKARLISSSLGSLETLSADNVKQVVEQLGDTGVTRVLVTDNCAGCIYDSDTGDSQMGSVLMYSEIYLALHGEDTFYCNYENGTTLSYCSVPVMNYDVPVGAVYLVDYETEQSSMIALLERNMLAISIVLEALFVMVAIVLSVIFSARTKKILRSFPHIQNGEYDYKISLRGNDEYSVLAGEFDKLTDKLSESEEIRRRFVSDASHELKTPLASIKLLGETILQNDLDEDTQREFVGDICSEADRLNRMSQKLLQLSKMDSQIQNEDTAPVPISEVLYKVYRMLTPIADQRNIRLLADVQEEIELVCSYDDLYQVIFNLIENAIKYNRDSGSVTTQLKRENSWITIRVTDTGVGIPDESLGHIFERFYRVDKARSRAAGGSGLGLSIVHDIVVRNGGTITAEHAEPCGTSFVLTFHQEEGKPE